LKLLKILPIIGIILLLYILIEIGVDKALEELLSLNPIYPIIAIILLIPRTLMVTKKWEYIIKKQEIKVPYSFVVKTYFIATFYGSITPGWLGTYIRIPYLMKKGKISLGKATSNLVIDTLVDLLSILLIVFIGTLLVFSKFPNLFPIVALLFVIIILAIFYFSSKKRSERYFKLILKFLIPSKYKQSINKQFNFFYESIPKIRVLIYPIFVSVITSILAYTQVYLIAQGLGIEVEYYYFILVYPVVFLVELIPITISGLGTRETALIGLLSVFAIAEDKIIVLSLTSHFVNTVIIAIIGAFLAIKDSLINKKSLI
jgi:hypothetical protein